MSSKLKSDVCKQLIEQKLVKPYDVIEHSFTDGGVRNITRLIVSTDGIFPTITTRPDDAEYIAIAITTCCLPYYIISEDLDENRGQNKKTNRK